jgi:signal transduction histidine kinase
MIWGGAVGLLVVLLGLLACLGITRARTRPLAQLAVIVRRLTSGDHAARAALRGTADARDMARSINALAEENERQRKRENESMRLRAAAREAGIRIREHLDLTEVIRETVAAIEGFVPNDTAYLHLIKDGRMGLPEAHEHDWIMPAEFAEFPTELIPVMVEVLARRSSQVLQDLNGADAASVPPTHLAMLREAGIVSFLVTPFGIGSELAGVIAAMRSRPGHPWTPAEIDAFQQIGADIGRALHHARQYEAENRLVEELKAVDQRKSTFIATVSHELRTPLTSIAGYVEILREADAPAPTPMQTEMLDIIGRNVARLQNLIEDVLTLSKIESGTFRTAMRPVDLVDVVTAAVTALEANAAGAGLTLTTTLPRRGLVVNGDPGQLDRVLMNLLSNAVKFTPKGGHVEVTVAAEGDMAVMTVRDTGIGIPEADKALVLTHFFRASNAVEQSIPGTGLGLAIVRTIVANHGGELDIDSGEKRGTTITVRIAQLSAGRVPRDQHAGSGTPDQ